MNIFAQMRMLLRDHKPDDGGGSDGFEKKMLDGIGTIEKTVNKQSQATQELRTNQEKILGDIDRLDGETKKALEDMALLQKNANDTQANINQFLRKLSDIDRLVKRQSLHEFGDPVKRIVANEEMRTKLNVAFRLALSKNNDMTPVINKILDKSDKSISEVIRKALGEDSSPGSTLIDDDLSSEIYHTLENYGTWNTFGVRPVSTNQTKFPVQTARVDAQFILTEGSAVSDDSTKAGAQVTCTMEVIAALLYVSIQLIQDSETELASHLLNDFAEAYSARLDYACYQADGTADGDNGGMTGVLSGGTAANATAGNSTVETTDFEDWQRCLLTVDPAVLQRPARWWMHPQILVRALAVRDGNGRPIFLNALDAPAAGSVGSILGYPTTMAAQMPTTNAAAATPAVFGDPNGLVVGVRSDFMFESSDEYRWAQLQRTFRGWGRAGVIIRSSSMNPFAVLTLTA